MVYKVGHELYLAVDNQVYVGTTLYAVDNDPIGEPPAAAVAGLQYPRGPKDCSMETKVEATRFEKRQNGDGGENFFMNLTNQHCMPRQVPSISRHTDTDTWHTRRSR